MNLSHWAGCNSADGTGCAWNNPGLLISMRNDSPNGGPPQRRISSAEVRLQFSLFCVLASPLILSGSITHMATADLQTYTNRNALSISQDPLGRQGIRIAGPPLAHGDGSGNAVVNIWARSLKDDGVALLFLNLQSKAVNISCDAACLAKANFSLSSTRTSRSHRLGTDTMMLRVLDVWRNGTNSTVAAGESIVRTVAGGTCALLIVRREKQKQTPQRLGFGTSGGPFPNGTACVVDEDCSLNGVCTTATATTNGACTCDPGWRGAHCQYLNLAPITAGDNAQGISLLSLLIPITTTTNFLSTYTKYLLIRYGSIRILA